MIKSCISAWESVGLLVVGTLNPHASLPIWMTCHVAAPFEASVFPTGHISVRPQAQAVVWSGGVVAWGFEALVLAQGKRETIQAN